MPLFQPSDQDQLLLPAGGAGALTGVLGVAPIGGASSVPGAHFDGDYSSAQPCGAMRPAYPFENEGDKITVVVKQLWEQSLANFAPSAPGTPHPANPALYLISEGDPQDLGGGVGRWERQYASLPPTRSVPESFVYSFQYYVLTTGQDPSLFEVPRTVASRVVNEYFLFKDSASWPALLAPRIIQFGKIWLKKGQGDLHPIGAPTGFVSDDAVFIAEDSKIEIWHFPILVRKTRYIEPPTAALLGSAIATPGA